MFSAVSMPSIALPANLARTPVAESRRAPNSNLKVGVMSANRSEVSNFLCTKTAAFYVPQGTRHGSPMQESEKSVLGGPYSSGGHADDADSGETCAVRLRNGLTQKRTSRKTVAGAFLWDRRVEESAFEDRSSNAGRVRRASRSSLLLTWQAATRYGSHQAASRRRRGHRATRPYGVLGSLLKTWSVGAEKGCMEDGTQNPYRNDSRSTTNGSYSGAVGGSG